MHLNIKNDNAHRMAKELARLRGTSMTEAVIEALERQLEEERQRTVEERGSLESQLRPFIAKMKALPVLDSRPGDEILYDEDGLPK